MQISTVIMFGKIGYKISQYFAPKYIQVLMLDAWFCPFNLKRNSRTNMNLHVLDVIVQETFFPDQNIWSILMHKMF